MATVTLPKKEYERLKRFSSAYIKIAEEITKAEGAYPYDYRFIHSLTHQARKDYKRGRFVEAQSVDEAIAKLHPVRSPIRKRIGRPLGV